MWTQAWKEPQARWHDYLPSAHPLSNDARRASEYAANPLPARVFGGNGGASTGPYIEGDGLHRSLRDRARDRPRLDGDRLPRARSPRAPPRGPEDLPPAAGAHRTAGAR